MDENITGNDRIDTTDASTENAVVTDAAVSEATVENIEQSNFEEAGAQTVEQPQAAPESTSNVEAQAEKPYVYYTESYKKTKTKKIGLFQLILVAVISSIFGAGMFAGFQLLLPVFYPALGGNADKTAVADTTTANNGIYKKVEIAKSDSPVTAIAEKVSPSIVGVKITVASQGGGFFFDSQQGGTGEGSGIIIRENGYILTNNHVIEKALSGNTNKLSEGSQIEVVLPSQKDKTYTATVVGRDVDSDIAVIKIEATGLPAAELGDSDKLKPGELAVAIGSPYGLDYMSSITAGIVSGLNRIITMDSGNELSLIQTDAAINPGNSGGALCNSQGQVIGINTVKIAATGFEGLGFAIPINHAKEISQNLIDFKYVKGKPYLGIVFNPMYNVPTGLYIFEVDPQSAAFKTGIKSGDIITKFDGKEIKEFKDLESQKNKHKAGDNVKVEVNRDGKPMSFDVVLDEYKNQ